MKKFIYNALAFISFCTFMFGMGAMDSENLALPVVLCLCGLFGTVVFEWWLHESE